MFFPEATYQTLTTSQQQLQVNNSFQKTKSSSQKFYIDKLKKKNAKKKLPSLEELSKQQNSKKHASDDHHLQNIYEHHRQSVHKEFHKNSDLSSLSHATMSRSCSSDVFELLEKLSTALILEKTKGISTTTIVIDNPDSAINGTEIEIKHYDTAPHSFHLNITTTPELHHDISSNILFLNQRLLHILPECKFFFSPPKYKSISSLPRSNKSLNTSDKKKPSPIEKNHGINH